MSKSCQDYQRPFQGHLSLISLHFRIVSFQIILSRERTWWADHFHKSWINSNKKMIRFEIDILPYVEFYILKEFSIFTVINTHGYFVSSPFLSSLWNYAIFKHSYLTWFVPPVVVKYLYIEQNSYEKHLLFDFVKC